MTEATSPYRAKPLRTLAQAQLDRSDWGKQATTPSYDLERGEVGSLRYIASEPHIDGPHIAWGRYTGVVTYKGENLGLAFMGSPTRCWGLHLEWRGASLIRGDIEDIGKLELLLRLFVSQQLLGVVA